MELKQWNPGDLLQLSGGYWSACALHAGVKLDLFTPLAIQGYSGPELAGILKTDSRALVMLLNALASLGLVEKKDRLYGATPFAAEYLSRTSPAYLGHIIMHHHFLMKSWADLDEAVKTGEQIRKRVSHEADEVERESFLMGMFNLAMQLAPKVVSSIDLTGRKRLLDLGGGPGTYAIHFCLHNPELSAVVYDLPSTRGFAEKTIARFGVEKRVTFFAGDFDSDQIEGSYDVAWLSHILHGEGPKGCAAMIGKTLSALEPGGLIMIQEFILDEDMTRPVFPALFSLNMLLGTEDGQAYSQSDIINMLAAAGATDIRRLSLEVPNGAGIITARKA